MAERRLEGIKGCVFDAYGTLLDFNSAVAHCRAELGAHADALSRTWRDKQLQYTWLRSLMGKHKDFWQVTGDALAFCHGFCRDARSGSTAKAHEPSQNSAGTSQIGGGNE